jgi:NAD(P)-dependent dehydrogenase (short-subunit alcohol dehydrogenase family)
MAAAANSAVAGKTFFITGATDGIGLHTARRLASLAKQESTAPPAALILHGRDRARLDRAAAEVAAVSSAVAVRTHLCDLCSGDLRALGEAVAHDAKELGLPLTVIHNAGVYATKREMVSPPPTAAPGRGASFERTWQTNVLAPFALQHALLKALGWRRRRNASSASLEPGSAAAARLLERVVVTSSLSAQHGPLDFANLQGERSWSAHGSYSLSKACNQAFAVRLGELLLGGEGGDDANDASSPGVFSLDPGTVNTKMLLAGWGPIGIEVEDADDTLWVATAPREALGATGGYFVGRRRARLVPAAADRATVDRLWALWREQTGCEELF